MWYYNSTTFDAQNRHEDTCSRTESACVWLRLVTSDLVLSAELSLWGLLLNIVLHTPGLAILMPGMTLVAYPWMAFAMAGQYMLAEVSEHLISQSTL